MYRRAVTSVSRAALRSSSKSVASTSVLASRSAVHKTLPTAARSFSNSSSRFSAGENDTALSAKLQSELDYEKDSSNPLSQEEPAFLQQFKAKGVWTIEDKRGADEVALKRTFGNEEIKVLFSIADIDNAPETETPEPNEEGAAENEDAEEEDQSPSLPIRTAITISKGAGNGAMTIDAVAQDGLFLVDNISLYSDENLALELTSEADWKRRGLYMGPAFDHLDEALQGDFESFLEERGIDSNLALFIPDLAEYKEQKEYVKWLQNVKKFIDA